MENTTNDDKLFISKINDLFKLCDKYSSARFSMFLDEGKQGLIKDLHNQYGHNTVLYGGYSESERKIFGVFPEWESPENSSFPIVVIKITHTFGESLSHRDYLGSILSVGIDRNKTGDILVDGNTAYAFVMEDISLYVKENIQKIANRGVSVELLNASDIVVPEKKFENIEVLATSMRLDVLIAAILNVSRSASAVCIESGKVSVNHRVIYELSHNVCISDLISIRGFGRVRVSEIGAITRKGRQRLVLKKYI